MKLSKAEKIMALLNQWDPDGRYKNGAGAYAYSYEGETIAQHIRKNSKKETVEKSILDTFSDLNLDDSEVRQMAEYIMSAVIG